MTTYPGPDPEKPEDQPADQPEDEPGTEPTQPVGYWERQAAERRQDPHAPSGGAVFNPTSAQPSSGWSQPGEQGWQQPYAPPYTQQYSQPYSQQQPPPGYGYPPPGGQSGGPPPGYGYPPYGGSAAPRPDHPQANLAMILGIVGLVGGFVCGLGFLASPFAWSVGRSALKEIEASRGRLGGEGPAKAGVITGIIGTVLLVIGLLLLAGAIVLIAAGSSSSTGNV